jgi:hypothetical protein
MNDCAGNPLLVDATLFEAMGRALYDHVRGNTVPTLAHSAMPPLWEHLSQKSRTVFCDMGRAAWQAAERHLGARS